MVADSHHFDDSDQHYSEKMEPDQHENDADLQPCRGCLQ
jgi:hypothetical protein